MTLRNFNTVLELLTAVPVVAFVLNYFVRSKWYKNSAGWNLLIFMAIVGELLVLGLWYRISGHRAPEWLATVCWTQISAAAWWRLGLLVHAQSRQRTEIRRAEEREHAFEADKA